MARHSRYYNQLDASCSIAGTALLDFADGESIRVNYNGDQSSLTVGTDGSVQNLNSNRAGTIEVDLKETSPSNDFLTGLLTAQRNGQFLDLPGTVVDGTAATHSGTGGTIKTPANVSTGGPAMGKRTWVFEFTVLNTDR